MSQKQTLGFVGWNMQCRLIRTGRLPGTKYD